MEMASSPWNRQTGHGDAWAWAVEVLERFPKNRLASDQDKCKKFFPKGQNFSYLCLN
jgi:hypothetical protein